MNIIDFIQNILDNHNGYINVKRLPALMSKNMRDKLSIRINDTATSIFRALEKFLDDKFIFHKKGAVLYIMTPQDPEELVLSLIAAKINSPQNLARLTPFTKKEMQSIINMLIDEKRVKISFNELLEPRIILLDSPIYETSPSKEYTFEDFKRAFDALDKGKIFVRICDLRKKLAWPRDAFDDMLRKLRDKEIIQLHTGDASLMTSQEIQDSFIDENNFRLGTVTWHVR